MRTFLIHKQKPFKTMSNFDKLVFATCNFLRENGNTDENHAKAIEMLPQAIAHDILWEATGILLNEKEGKE